MHIPPPPKCPLCKSAHTYSMTKKLVPGVRPVVRRTWNCVVCLHQWLASEEDKKPYPHIEAVPKRSLDLLD